MTVRIDNYTLKDAAVRLGVSPHTLRFWAVYCRKISYLRLGRKILFSPADLDTFEQQNLVKRRHD